jgi:hypothetical protein
MSDEWRGYLIDTTRGDRAYASSIKLNIGEIKEKEAYEFAKMMAYKAAKILINETNDCL